MFRRFSHRVFLGDALAAGFSTALLDTSAPAADESIAAKSKPPAHKIKLGLIGCGGRGPWLAGLFKQHGGYELQENKESVFGLSGLTDA